MIWQQFGTSHDRVLSSSDSVILTYAHIYRSLADQDNRGKLSIPEFHVAMGLIYRRMFRLSVY